MRIESECDFTVGWLNCFKDKHGVCKLDITGESKSAEEFSEEFNRLVAEHDLTPNHIYNSWLWDEWTVTLVGRKQLASGSGSFEQQQFL